MTVLLLDAHGQPCVDVPAVRGASLGRPGGDGRGAGEQAACRGARLAWACARWSWRAHRPEHRAVQHPQPAFSCVRSVTVELAGAVVVPLVLAQGVLRLRGTRAGRFEARAALPDPSPLRVHFRPGA